MICTLNLASIPIVSSLTVHYMYNSIWKWMGVCHYVEDVVRCLDLAEFRLDQSV
jgi:hypothetical protein